MNNNQWVVFLLSFTLLIIAVPLIGAVSEFEWASFPSGTVEIDAFCKTEQGTLCDSGTTCNISQLRNPDETINIQNAIMTRKYDGKYNYSLSLTTEGDYTVEVVCTNTSLLTRQMGKLRVVDKLLTTKLDTLNLTLENLTLDNIAADIWAYQLGSNLSANTTLTEVHTNTKGIPDIALILSSLTMSGIFFFMGFSKNGKKREEEEDSGSPMKPLFFIGGMLGIILSLNIARASAEASNASTNLVSMINTSYILSLWIFLIATIIIFILVISKIIKGQKLRNEMEEEGLFDEE